jgi:hypothetical protein
MCEALPAAGPALSDHLRELRWSQRVILWHWPKGDPPPAETARVAAQSAALGEYRLTVFAVGPETARQLFPADNPTTYATGESLARLGLTGPGGSLLLGLDGGVKARQKAPLDWAAYFAAIDRMPMRRVELGRDADPDGSRR